MIFAKALGFLALDNLNHKSSWYVFKRAESKERKMTLPVLLKLSAGGCWAMRVAGHGFNSQSCTDIPNMQDEENSFTNSVLEESKERDEAESSVVFSLFLFFYYEKELGALLQSWHLALLHL